MSLDALDERTRALVALAAAIAVGDEADLAAQCDACLAAAVPLVWVDELLLQSTLMVGWPRALMGAAAWRTAGAAIAFPAEGGDADAPGSWRKRGEDVCRVIYGRNYDRLRSNVRNLHPALDEWMVTEGYGRTLGRPGLDLARRELCIVVQVALQGAERQLHSHLRGALHAGATRAAVEQALNLVRPRLGAREAEILAHLWNRITGT
ncbi:MAG TPA: carboxymuconolactone decarboxylase family protein [Gemmatimonadales bacterium]